MIRPSLTLRVICSGLALTLALAAQAVQQRFEQAGRLQSSDGERAAFLHVGCSPDSDGGALVIELVATEANKRKDFDYDDFEGPDAAAAKRALSHLDWIAAAGKTEITHVAAGWYAPETPESFIFGVNQLSHRSGPVANLLAAIGTSGGRFVWMQTGFDDPKRQLVANFDLDVNAAQHLHDTVAACLSKSN